MKHSSKDLVNGLKRNQDVYPDFFTTAAKRYSCRDFISRNVKPAHLDKILRAGCMAPVGMKKYEDLHLTVLLGAAAVNRVEESRARQRGLPLAQARTNRMTYGARTVVVISSKPALAPGLEYANASCVAENMLLAAAALDVDSIYLWSVAHTLQGDPALAASLGIPEGYKPVCAVALGYAKPLPEGMTRVPRQERLTIETNYVKE